MDDTKRIRCDHVFKQGPRKGAVCGSTIYRGVSTTKCHRHVGSVSGSHPEGVNSARNSARNSPAIDDAPISVEKIRTEPTPVQALPSNEEEPILPPLPEINTKEDFFREANKIKATISAKKKGRGDDTVTDSVSERQVVGISKFGRTAFVSLVGLTEIASGYITDKLEGYTVSIKDNPEIMECVDEIVKDLMNTYMSGDDDLDPYTKLCILMVIQAGNIITQNLSKKDPRADEIAKAREELEIRRKQIAEQEEVQQRVRAELLRAVEEQESKQRQQQQVEPSAPPAPSFFATGIVVEGEDAQNTPTSFGSVSVSDDFIDLSQFRPLRP